MNQTTNTNSTHPVDPQALHLQLKEDGKFYCGSRNSEEAREQLLHTLQTNDCREIINAVVYEDDLANAFVQAGYKRHINILAAFIHHGMNIDIKDKTGWTALMCASRAACEECIRFLLDHNAKVDFQSNSGYTALMYASQRGFIKIVEVLLEKNANLDIQDKNGMTALMWASTYGNKEIVEVLLNHNADIDLKNNEGKTALDLTRNEEINELIQNHVSTSYVLK